jgi:DNA-binding ferritin-like protein
MITGSLLYPSLGTFFYEEVRELTEVATRQVSLANPEKNVRELMKVVSQVILDSLHQLLQDIESANDEPTAPPLLLIAGLTFILAREFQEA